MYRRGCSCTEAAWSWDTALWILHQNHWSWLFFIGVVLLNAQALNGNTYINKSSAAVSIQGKDPLGGTRLSASAWQWDGEHTRKKLSLLLSKQTRTLIWFLIPDTAENVMQLILSNGLSPLCWGLINNSQLDPYQPLIVFLLPLTETRETVVLKTEAKTALSTKTVSAVTWSPTSFSSESWFSCRACGNISSSNASNKCFELPSLVKQALWNFRNKCK